MADDAWQNPENGASKDEVAFDYVKSNDFRVIWSDGAIGGVTPNGLIHVAFFSERQAIPRRQVYKILQDGPQRGALSSEVVEKQISRGSIVRDMACDVMMSPQAALNLANWLLSQVEQFDAVAGKKEK